MLGEKSLAGRSSLFLHREARTVLATPSLPGASHFKKYWGSDKCGAVFRSIDDLPACFCMGRYLCLEPNLPVANIRRLRGRDVALASPMRWILVHDPHNPAEIPLAHITFTGR